MNVGTLLPERPRTPGDGNVIKLVSFRPTLSDRRESNGEWTKEISERMRLRFLSAPGENP